MKSKTIWIGAIIGTIIAVAGTLVIVSGILNPIHSVTIGGPLDTQQTNAPSESASATGKGTATSPSTPKPLATSTEQSSVIIRVGIFYVSLPCDKLITTVTKEYSLHYGINIEASEHCNWSLSKQTSDKYEYAVYVAYAASELKFFGMNEHSGLTWGETNFDTKTMYIMKTYADSYVLTRELSHMWLFKKGYPADLYLSWVNSRSDCYFASGKQDCYVSMRFTGGGTMYKVMPFYEANLPDCKVNPDGTIQFMYSANQPLCDIPPNLIDQTRPQEQPPNPVENKPAEQQCQAKYGQGSYYDSAQNRCLGGSVGTSAPVDQNALCRERFWWIVGIYYNGQSCVPPAGWTGYKPLTYRLEGIPPSSADYSIDVSGERIKAAIEKSISTRQSFDTLSWPTMHYEDYPGKNPPFSNGHHIVADVWYLIKPTEGNNLDFTLHLDDAIIEGKSCGNKEIHGSAVYHPEDATIRGTKTISELQNSMQC